MPRVRRQKASGRARRVCGALGCGKEIPKGEEYYTWSFRGTGRQVRCLDHPPQPADLTQSRMSDVYRAISEAGNPISEAETIEDVKEAVTSVAEAAREVVDEYRQAAESFGGAGPNAERADELEGWVDELESFEPEEPEEEEFDENAMADEAKDRCEQEGDISFAFAMQVLHEEWDQEHSNDNSEAVENARTEANDLLGRCPL